MNQLLTNCTWIADEHSFRLNGLIPTCLVFINQLVSEHGNNTGYIQQVNLQWSMLKRTYIQWYSIQRDMYFQVLVRGSSLVLFLPLED